MGAALIIPGLVTFLVVSLIVFEVRNRKKIRAMQAYTRQVFSESAEYRRRHPDATEQARRVWNAN